MGGLNVEIFHAKKRKVMAKLGKGKEIALQLQTLLDKPVEEHGPISLEDLALQIFRSFADSLSEFADSAQISAVDCGGSACSGESSRKPGVKDRRGCYKRRRSSDSWELVSPTTEDNCAWRKYGQKNILNSEFPRCYYRCTYKQEGCKATKQVQRIKGDTIQYKTTYFNRHTCTATLRAPHLAVGPEPVDPKLISFQTNLQPGQDHQDSTNPINDSSVKQEDAQSEGVFDDNHDDTWQDIIGLDYRLEWAPYQEEVASCFRSCDASGLHGLDMEVNQISDIDSFHYFD